MLHSKIKCRLCKLELEFNDFVQLTAITLPIHQLPPNKILDPERLTQAGPCGLVAASVSRTLVLADERVQTEDLKPKQAGVRSQLGLKLFDNLLA